MVPVVMGLVGGCCRRAWRHRSEESCVSAMTRRGQVVLVVSSPTFRKSFRRRRYVG